MSAVSAAGGGVNDEPNNAQAISDKSRNLLIGFISLLKLSKKTARNRTLKNALYF
jgi:hypothetical protein